MASIHTDNAAGRMRTDFEAAAAHLLPYDPVAKKRTTSHKCGGALISSTEAEIGATTGGGKAGIEMTGVHLRFHTKAEYHKLTHEQKGELKQWRMDNPDKVQPPPNKRQKTQSYTPQHLASLVSKQVKAELNKGSKAQKNSEEAKAYIMSVIRDALPTVPAPAPAANASSAAGGVTLPPAPPTLPTPPAVPGALRSILWRSRD